MGQPQQNQESRYEDTLSSLIEICSGFFAQMGRGALIQRIVSSGISLTSGDRGSLFLADDMKGEKAAKLRSMIATGMGGEHIVLDATAGVVGHVYQSQEPIILNDAQADPMFFSNVDKKTQYETKTILCVPLRTPGNRTIGALEILNSRKGKFDEQDMQILQILALFASVALEQSYTIENLETANKTLKVEKDAWLGDHDQIRLRSHHQTLNELYERLPVFAQADSSILIQGESGTGKEVVAKAIHSQSRRRDQPFVAINCAAIPESLFEAEFFGVSKGAATGTVERKGKIEMADGGTLFLDEIGELPLSMQAKLLRVLQDRSLSRLGSDEKPIQVDFRLIAATNRDLAKGAETGEFREDLFYRINVVQFRLAPLRERPEDIEDLSYEILSRFERSRGWKPKKMSREAIEKLKIYPWPGNIRQLQNKLEAAMIASSDREQIEVSDFQFEPSAQTTGAPLVSEPVSMPKTADLNLKRAKQKLEKEMIDRALSETKGNRTQAAKLLGLSREGLRKALAKLS